MAMNAHWRQAIHGALAGAIGAASMTVLRMLARRAGYIEQMVPQAVEAWSKQKLALPTPTPNQSALHHVADQAMHLGYGATFGALYAVTIGQRGASVPRATLFGLGVWGFGSFVLLPALEITRPEWRASAGELAVNLAAHCLYAASVSLLTDELEHQAFARPVQYPLSLTQRTG